MGFLVHASSGFRQPFYTEFHKPKEPTPKVEPGDIVLTHGNHIFSKLIRFGQRLRYKGVEKSYAYWNHVAIVVDDDGHIVEALGDGVQKTHLSDYQKSEYVVARVVKSKESRQQMIDYLEWVACIEKDYNWGLIGLIGIELITGGNLSINLDGSEICSTLAAEALKSAGIFFNRGKVMPADIAYVFSLDTPIG